MSTEKAKNPAFKRALKIIILFGLVAMFGDMVYESMRGSSGQYMSTLGVEMTQFALILGIGEFLAYALRLVAGIAADKSRKYWIFIYVGYGLLVVVPFMGVTTFLPAILSIMMIERIAKAIRNPAKDIILSHVAETGGGKVGLGFAFGLNEAFDKFGAFVGPMIFTVIFIIARNHGIDIGVAQYQLGYRLLAIPFVLMMVIIFIMHRKVARERLMETAEAQNPAKDKIQPVFWTYTAFTFMTMMGFAQFPLIAFHLRETAVMSDDRIILFYSIIMVVNALLAVAIGVFYDWIKRKTGNKQSGLLTLMFIPVAAAAIPFLTLSMSVPLITVGFMLFGAIIAAHETIMRSAIADITSLRKRGTGYGIFNTAYGGALLIGALIFSQIYEHFGISAVQITLVVAQVIAMVLFFVMRIQIGKNQHKN
ncbi:MAG: MFS transporter [Oscillospiraceae bacterium]|nr:MFS transporter [Oscillospiraceae bacterium]MCL2278437.1 MFS transporter [Oscillospiraceae bacterium]